MHGASSIISDADVSAEMDQYNLFENKPLKGNVAIIHNVNSKVDTSSFLIDKKPLKVIFVKTVKMSANSQTELSIYQFELPTKPPGLYVLSPISVKVGKETFTSVATSYQVNNAAQAPKAPVFVQQTTPKPVKLTLEAKVEGPPKLFPGLRTHVIYRFLFQGNIELVTENLPMLTATGFQKIGDEQGKDYSEGDVSVHEVSQEIQALTPGEFKFPPSFIEGYAYTEGVAKTRTLIEPKIKSETAEMILTVLPFPTAGKPDSFKGAVGQFTFKAELRTPSRVHVDDKIILVIDITAEDNNLHTVELPDLSAAGFPEIFRMEASSSTGEVKDQTKRFTIELHPLTTEVKEIPSIEFSFFNPKTEKYVILHSNSFPLKVMEVEKEPPPKKESIKQEPIVKEEELTIFKPTPVEIEGNYVDDRNGSSIPFGTLHIFWIIPIGILAIVAQMALRKHLAQKAVQKQMKTGQNIFNDALKMPFNGPEFYKLLNAAFMKKLVERGEIESENMNPESLPTTGYAGKVREFLVGLEARRFTSGGKLDQNTVIKEAQTLFNTK